MPSKKIYADVDFYERKLKTVMDRLGVKKYNYNWNRHGGWVDFQLKNEWYRFEHSVSKAQAKGIKLQYGSDAFAQVWLQRTGERRGERNRLLFCSPGPLDISQRLSL